MKRWPHRGGINNKIRQMRKSKRGDFSSCPALEGAHARSVPLQRILIVKKVHENQRRIESFFVHDDERVDEDVK